MSWVAALSDRMNPLVVKELRQGVRSRVLWSAFALLLTACLVISLIAFLGSVSGELRGDGRQYFAAFFTCTCLVYLFVIPSMAYQSLVREQEGDTWPLLTMTGLGARRILRGKLGSSLVIAVLYSSVVLPFLLFAYYLNGIELATILWSVGAAAVLMVFLTFTSVCWATFGNNRVIRGALRVVFILGTLQLASIAAGLSYSFFQSGHRWTSSNTLVAFALLWIMGSFSYLFHEVAVSRLSLESEDFSRGPRRATMVQILGSWALVLLVWRLEGPERRLPQMAQLWICALLSLAGVYLASDRDGLPRALRGRLRGWNLLLPGAVRGFRLFVLLVGFSTALSSVMISWLGQGDHNLRALQSVLAAGGYSLAFVSFSLLLGHLAEIGQVTVHLRSRIAFAVVVLLGALPPVLLDVVVPPLSPWAGLLSPVGGLVHFDDGDFHARAWAAVAAVAVTGLLLTLLADRVLGARDERALTPAGEG
jgi:hypothetical protein